MWWNYRGTKTILTNLNEKKQPVKHKIYVWWNYRRNKNYSDKYWWEKTTCKTQTFYIGPPASAPPFFRLSGHFLGIVSLVFSNFLHGARNPYEVVCDRAGFSGKKSSLRQKLGIYWICWIIKSYFIWCIPVQILYLGKFLLLRYGPKCSQSDCRIFPINYISRTNQGNSLIIFILIQLT